MNILLLAPHPFFQHRGTPIAVKLLIEVLSGHGYKLQILTYHEGEDIDIPNVPIHRVPKPPWVNNIKPGPSCKKIICDLFMFWQCIKIVRGSRFDIIHAVEESAFMALVLKKIFHIPYVYDMDSSIPQQIADKYKFLLPIKKILEFVERIAVRNSTGVIAVCKSLENIALKYDPGQKVLRLEDISLLKSDTQEGDLLFEKMGISRPIIMYVGNLESYQGIDLLLDGFRDVAIKDNDAQLVVIGGSDMDIRRYKSKSNDLNIENKVHFIGRKPISQLNFYLEQSDIVVSPRINGQNTPMKIYSYLDSGKPLLATRLPTHTQVLDDNIAYLVEPEPVDFANGLTELLKDKLLRRRLALKAKERVQKEFSYEAFQRKLLTFYSTLQGSLCH
ncbi:MAG: glycosyltransferase family 4 protein [Planctomycetota bacterium]